MQQSQNKKTNERFLAISFCAVLFLPAVNNFLNCFFQMGMDAEVPYLTETSYITMMLLGVFSALRSVTKNAGIFFVSALILVGCAVSYFIYPEMRKAIYEDPVDLIYNPINRVVFFCVPALIYSAALTSYDGLFALMTKWARVTLVIGVFTFYYVYFVADGILQYMVFSYFMLTPICVCFENYLQHHQKKDLVLYLLGFFAILLCGARGAILSFLIYFVIRLLSHKGKGNSAPIAKLILAFILFLVIFFWEDILVWLYDFTVELGIDSRFITSLIKGTLSESSGRDTIAEAIFKGIESNPFGYGLFGDRYVVGSFDFRGYTYAHNFFLEIICSFGIFFSIPILLMFFNKLFKAISRKDIYYNRVLWSLIPYGFFQLFFSSSAIENVAFYMICAIIFKNNKRSSGETERIEKNNEGM